MGDCPRLTALSCRGGRSLLALSAVALVGMIGIGPQETRVDVRTVHAPTVVWRHHVIPANAEMFVLVRIVPHALIRAVILEAWERAEMGERVILRRSSVEPVERGRTAYYFLWRAGLQTGMYELIARVLVSRGLTVASTPVRVLVV